MGLHSHSHGKNTWQIQEAKTYFSKLIHCAETDGLQKITRQGHEVAVVMSMQEYDKLVRPKTSLVEFFTDSPLSEIDIPIKRSKDPMREVDL
jgi:prevent-host-death family protein